MLRNYMLQEGTCRLVYVQKERWKRRPASMVRKVRVMTVSSVRLWWRKILEPSVSGAFTYVADIACSATSESRGGNEQLLQLRVPAFQCLVLRS